MNPHQNPECKATVVIMAETHSVTLYC